VFRITKEHQGVNRKHSEIAQIPVPFQVTKNASRGPEEGHIIPYEFRSTELEERLDNLDSGKSLV
jgi:hypothetical protein